MTSRQIEALRTLLGCHRSLEDGVEARLGALARAVTAGRPHKQAAAGLVAYLTRAVLPHAQAEEAVICWLAARSGLADQVARLTGLGQALAAATEAIGRAPAGLAALACADAAAALFAAHLATEDEVVFLTLVADEQTDLTDLLRRQHQRGDRVGPGT